MEKNIYDFKSIKNIKNIVNLKKSPCVIFK